MRVLVIQLVNKKRRAALIFEFHVFFFRKKVSKATYHAINDFFHIKMEMMREEITVGN